MSAYDIQFNILAFPKPITTLQCKHCAHLFIEHDDYGCKHSACSCKISQRKMMRNGPDLSLTQVDDFPRVLDIDAWLFTKQYPNIPPSALFDAIAKSLQDKPFFKIWKVDNDKKYINLTTHSIRPNPSVNYHQAEADVKVLEGKDASSSVVNIRITPTLIGVLSLYEAFTNVDVNTKFAKYVANLIFGAVEEGYHV